VATTTTPNQRLRIFQPSIQTSTHRELIAAQLPQVLVINDASDGDKMGLASASRRAAISVSVGLRTAPRTSKRQGNGVN
jgi:hypothetical protein